MSYVSRYLEPALVEHLNHMQLSARSVVEGSIIGQHRSPIKGASVEFRQHRFYTPGDELRRLDWRVLGRTDRPYVKEYDEETNLRCVLMLDCSASMGYTSVSGSKFDYAAKLLAALSYLMLGQRESVGIALCGQELDHWLAPHSGPTQLSRVIDSLESAAPLGVTGIANCMHEIADRLERRALVIAVSDFFLPADQIRSGLAHLRHDRHEVICVQVVDRDEEEFPFQNWIRFRGVESDGSRVCEPAVLRKSYLEAFQTHRRQLERASIALRAEFQSCTTDKPLLETIRWFLRRRQ